MKSILCTAAVLAAVLTFTTLSAQSGKYEFRSVWVATVANIDWPSRPGLSVEKQKEEIIRILDMHKANGMNAIILQVRPAADAIYKSDLEPWSRYLSGEQGVVSDTLFDPLEFWITEAHKRAMELHAWLNPYRVRQNSSETLAENHIAYRHPDWVFDYGGKTYFQPAQPGVWQFVCDVVVDIVKRYDIDAVHFDDYFYPYRIQGEEFPDDSLFALYGGEFYPGRKDDWRRQNVDTIIHMLSLAIKETKPWVKFGISPFGVWRNRTEDPLGSESRAGTTNYDALYADVIKWQRLGWIDYLMPQIYWRDDHPQVDFSTLAYWWNDMDYGRSLYVGLAPYRIDRKSEYRLWKRDRYFLQQIGILRELNAVEGYGMFSSNHFFREDLAHLNKQLRKKINPCPAIVPPMKWIDAIAPACPLDPVSDGNAIKWKPAPSLSEFDNSRFYVVYRFGEDERNLKNASKIVTVTGEEFIRFDNDIPKGIYRISALDRLNNESQLSAPLLIE
ncbi:MAG: glycoside hydrolase family 10 protein [Bacteroidota bacterium]